MGQVNLDLKLHVATLIDNRWAKSANSPLTIQTESYVQQDGPFLYVPGKEAHTATVSQIWELVKNQTAATREDVEAFLRDLKKELASSKAADAYHPECVETAKY